MHIHYVNQERIISDEGPKSIPHRSLHRAVQGEEGIFRALRLRFDQSKRVTLEFPVLDVVLDKDKILQESVESGWLSDAHMTVLHLGRIHILVDDLRKAGAIVDADIVTSQLANAWAPLLAPAAVERPFQLEATDVTELSFGVELTRVLDIAVTPTVQKIRNDARDALLSVIARNGIGNPEGFMAESSAIQQPSPTWHPHVSLPPSLSQQFPERPIPAGTLKLSFGELRLR